MKAAAIDNRFSRSRRSCWDLAKGHVQILDKNAGTYYHLHALLSKVETALQQAHRVFEEHQGTLRTSEALRAGIHPRTLYALRDGGYIEQITRGLFRLAELPPPGEPDLLTIAKKVPLGVFCLLTALAYHRLTTQVPHAVDVALPRTARVPRMDHPPINVYWFSLESFQAGIENHVHDGVAIRVYSREKNLSR